VTVNGLPAPLWFVSPGQINFQVPYAISTVCCPAPELNNATIVVTTPSGSSGPVQVPVAGPQAIGIFTLNGSGCGAGAVLNVSSATGAVSVNSPSNSASPGDYLAIFATGLGPPATPVPDGTPADGPAPLNVNSRVYVYLGGSPLPNFYYSNAPAPPPGFASLIPVPDVSYQGLAPGYAGMYQVNVQVPPGAEGCAVPLQVAGNYDFGQIVSVSIHSGGGQCQDAPVQSYGQILLTKTISSGATPSETDTLTATFPSGPALQILSQAQILSSGSGGYGTLLPEPYCGIPGQSDLRGCLKSFMPTPDD
jgi:uncharacterized protein (TIGR03437 family)